jgi:hypothetical protein
VEQRQIQFEFACARAALTPIPALTLTVGASS